MSATSRTTLKQTKIVLVWLFFLAYQGKGHESFKVLQLVGFIVLVSGILLYNEIVVIPFWGFNQNITLKNTKDESKDASETSNHFDELDNEQNGGASDRNPMVFSGTDLKSSDLSKEKLLTSKPS
mmetsp:Transcript_29139/g.33329  ORF Transcript_29139/g.33329 Transcript_29139/m.33329 type:complete len:125 (+) Transcript_29139:692-1066(+)